ncbi:MFS-type transporter SLC18B1-like [Sycon ciliatum]|uniref:MFS-type transporter SLC18B1-like n=1 Tax=Sycon ciliatum TaxID=27933 RepID=UPI0020A90F67
MSEKATSSGHPSPPSVLQPLQVVEDSNNVGNHGCGVREATVTRLTVEAGCSGQEFSAVRKLLILATLAAILTMSDMTSLGGFFTNVALGKNASGGAGYHTAVGAVFAMLQAGSVLSAPFVTRELPYIGSKYMMALSMASMGAVQVIFAFVNRISDWRVFLVYCYIIRAIQGVCYTGVSIACSAYLTELYPNNVGFVNGFLLTFFCVGDASSQLLGGVLFDAGGFRAPFLASGPAMLVSALAVLIVLVDIDNGSSNDGTSETHVGVRVILRQPWIWLLMFALTVAALPGSGVEVVLGPHMLSAFVSSATLVGGALALKVAVSSATSPLIGYCLDRGLDAHAWIVIGYVLTGVSCLFLGPATFLHMPTSLWLVFVAIVPLAVGFIIATVSSIVAMTRHLECAGVGSAVEVRVAIAGVARICASAGMGLGFLLTTPLVAVMDFRAAMTLYGFVFLAAAPALGAVSWLHAAAAAPARHKAAAAEQSVWSKCTCLCAGVCRWPRFLAGPRGSVETSGSREGLAERIPLAST